jgi:5-formyltetrahydrofolate cyclo-ligase
MQTKREIRRQLRLTRKKLPERIRRVAEKNTNNYLKSMIKRNKRIAIYWALGGELDLKNWIATAQKRGAKVYLPYIEPHTLQLWFTPYPVSGSLKNAERKRGNSKLFVPQFSGKKIRAKHLNTLVLPIVGIDAQGYRLGQGGGYYDCTLANTPCCLKPRTVAVGFACQQVAHLPNLPHDICVDYFVSERGIVRF